LKIRTKIMLAMFAVFLPFILNLAFLYVTIEGMKSDGAYINVAGAMRMRTMLLANFSNRYYLAESDEELAKIQEIGLTAAKEHLTRFQGLREGDADVGLTGRNSDQVATSLDAVAKDLELYVAAVERTVNQKGSPEDLRLINEKSLPIRDQFNEITNMYQGIYDQRIATLKLVEVGFLLLGLIVLVTVSLLLSRGIVRPIQLVSSSLREIAQGGADLTRKIEVGGKDEVGELAAYFNQFQESIRSLITSVVKSSELVSDHAHTLNGNAAETAKATEQIAIKIQELAENATYEASELSKAAGETEASTEQAQLIVSAANDISSKATDSCSQAEEGNRIASTTVSEIESVQQSFAGLQSKMQDLGNYMQKIDIINATITSIAEQTNLLALNAAIEAARAGEQGRGFAVVADEVRKLAEGSAASATEISEMVRDILARVQEMQQAVQNSADSVDRGNQSVHNLGAIFGDIENSVRNVSNRIGEMTVSLERMSAGQVSISGSISQNTRLINESTKGTEEIASAAQEQTAMMEEMAASVNEMQVAAEEVLELVGKFRI